ncbi:DISARM system phospholipase D-like protein DrmC [Micromonospora sp. CPCC 206060]|uniref:DISARM system phospholipase D-like protein DrmC n=1 Tax=Micromonospora sp. CPCC 206060 TaxID=3122406 RepID=UPI002FEFAE41
MSQDGFSATGRGGSAAAGRDSFAAAVAATVAELPAGHVAAWANRLMRVATPDGSVEAALINARPGHLVAAPARRLVRAWSAEAPELTGPAVALALRSAAVLHQQSAGHRTELVVSGPTSPSVPVRLTSSVVVELVRAARHSLLVVSFAAYGVAEVVRELVAASSRGVRIDLVLEDSVDAGGSLRGPLGASAAFAELRDRATFWHWPARRRPGTSTGTSRVSLHAKIIAADTRAALVSSANLTDRALSNNLEVGVVLHDPEVVRRIVAHFAALMDPETGPLQPLARSG